MCPFILNEPRNCQRIFECTAGLAGSGTFSEEPSAYVHSLELKEKAFENTRSDGKTWVNIDLKQMGLGCINSWGAWPRGEYLVKAQPYEFIVHITPISNIN